MKRRHRALGSVAAVISLAGACLAVAQPSAASSGGPVLIDVSDTGYHGGISHDSVAQTRTLQAGWAYLARWYDLLTAAVPGSYANNGRIAVLGASGLDNDANDDFVPDDPFLTSAHCGVATYEIARQRGFDVDWYDTAASIGAYLDRVASGLERPRMIHIVEHTPDAVVGQIGELCRGGLDDAESSVLATKAAALGVHVNRGGALFANDQPYDWLSVLYPSIGVVPCGGTNGAFTPAGSVAFPTANPIDAQAPYHQCFTSSGPTWPLDVVITEGSDVLGLGGSSVVISGVTDTSSPTSTVPVVGGGSGGSGGGGVIGGASPTTTTTTTTVPACDGPCIERHGGADRFDTAALTARSFWTPGSVRSAVIALGRNFPDAIVGGPLAARFDAPVLLVEGERVPEETLATIRELGVERAYLMGGTTAISESVAELLREEALTVSRLWGSDRYGTSAVAARRWSTLPTSVVYMARGDQFADQLVAAHLAARAGVPLMLMRPDGTLTESVTTELRRLEPDTIVAVGVLLPSLEPLRDLREGDTVVRMSATDPVALSTAGLEAGENISSSEVLLVTGENWPDALAGVPVAARRGIPMVLTRSQCVASSTREFLGSLDLRDVIVLGGEAAVSRNVAESRDLCDR